MTPALRVDFSETITLEPGAHFNVPPDERWELYQRFVELDHLCMTPGVRMRLVDAAQQELAGWAPLITISMVPRIPSWRMTHPPLPPLARLRHRVFLPAGAEFWPEFDPRILAADAPDPLHGYLHVVGVKIRV